MTGRKMALKGLIFPTVLKTDAGNTDFFGLTAGMGAGFTIGAGGPILDNAEFTLALKSGNPGHWHCIFLNIGCNDICSKFNHIIA